MTTNAMVDELLRSDIVDDPARDGAAEPERAVEAAQRRRRWSRDASLAAIALGAVGGFLALTRVVVRRSDNPFDLGIVRAVGRTRSPIKNAIVQGLTFFGSVPGAGGLSAVAGSSRATSRGSRRRSRSVRWAASPQSSASSASSSVAVRRCSSTSRRSRARRSRRGTRRRLRRSTSRWRSSRHAARAFASIAASCSRAQARSRRRSGASRVYLGVHWPTDVLSGLAIGTAWACAAEALYDITGAEQVARQAASPAALPPPPAPPT